MTSGTLPFSTDYADALKYKIDTSAEQLCENTKYLLPFAKHVLNLAFDEEPNYNKLKFMLVKNLLDSDIIPSKRIEWNDDSIIEYNNLVANRD